LKHTKEERKISGYTPQGSGKTFFHARRRISGGLPPYKGVKKD